MRRCIAFLGGLWALAMFDPLPVCLAGQLGAMGSLRALNSIATDSSKEAENLNLPEHFVRLIRARAIVDAWQNKHHQIDPGTVPAPVNSYASQHRAGPLLRTVRAVLSPDALTRRAGMTNRATPPRGFRAPILEAARELPVALRLPDDLSSSEREAAAIIETQLAEDGLLATLAEVIATLGPGESLTNGPAVLAKLSLLGFPADLLRHFRAGEVAGSHRPQFILHLAARKLAAGASLAAVRRELGALPFDFVPSVAELAWAEGGTVETVVTGGHQSVFDLKILAPKFEAATESGENEAGLFRVQAGGGWRDGIVPGGSLDVIAQLAEVQRDARFLISVESEVAGPFAALITNSWRLRRQHQVTLCVESSPVTAWAQDNGKAGVVAGPGASPALATITPRYASTGEGQSTFEPGESFLMEGLRAAGHRVIHSPLLFQGGNLLVARHPKSGERILLLSEGTVHRNTALGLTREQVIRAFRREFGVDRCIVMPAASYHLDFDVCLRSHGGELLAFVNDHRAAIDHILGLGLNALERHGALDAAGARTAREDLAARRDLALLTRLTNAVPRLKAPTGTFPASLSRFFVADSTDDAAGNLQTFLLALDLLESESGTSASPAGNSERTAYLTALRRLTKAQQDQVRQLKHLGCRVVPIPSMSDLHRSINYLNGVHHRSGYLMPVFGGFYAPLDRAAQAAFHETLGADFKIALIRSAECQRKHGGVHCAVSAYPALPDSH